MLVSFIQINQEDGLTKLSETWDTTEPVGSQALRACSSKHAKNVNSAAVCVGYLKCKTEGGEKKKKPQVQFHTADQTQGTLE